MNTSESLRYASVLLRLILILSTGFSTSRAANAQSNKIGPVADSEQVVNLSDFGAVGDGVTDNGPAFQSALDALAAAGGGVLFVPAGRYLIASPVTKDFSGLNASLTIQGVPSDTMPAPPTAGGDQLSKSLDLTSEIIPATGSVASVFTLSNLHDLTIEHLAFTGREFVRDDAFITLNLSDVSYASFYHTEFYGISTLAGGNVVRAVRTDLSIAESSFLGCTANSGAYAPIVENIEWKGFTISNSIFLDYGQRSFFSKMGSGSPLSWINLSVAAPRTPESSRREVVVRDTFLDEGGWIGLTAFPHRWNPPDEIDLLYVSGLKMNVSNFGTAGNQFFDVKNVLIEDSYYGWSHNAVAAIDINRSRHAILDQLTCVESADRIRADAGTDRLTVINSDYANLDSLAHTTTVLETPPEEDPVQYVHQQFLSLLGRDPDAASHFYWSDLLVRCDKDQICRAQTQTELHDYLAKQPAAHFSLTGTVTDETGTPISGVTLVLTGSQVLTTLSDEQGKFQFSSLSTSGVYTVTANKTHYSFTTSSQTLDHPARDVSIAFGARLNRHSINGRVIKADGSGAAGVKIQLLQSSLVATTNFEGDYSFADLAEGDTYTILPSLEDAVFSPAQATFSDLAADTSSEFTLKLVPQLLKTEDSEHGLALHSISFVTQPFSIFDALAFGNDGVNRVMFFARNLEGINDPSQFSMSAEDSEGKTYPLEIEFIGDVPQQSWLKQLNVKLSPELSGKCVNLKLSVGGLTSSAALFCASNH